MMQVEWAYMHLSGIAIGQVLLDRRDELGRSCLLRLERYARMRGVGMESALRHVLEKGFAVLCQELAEEERM